MSNPRTRPSESPLRSFLDHLTTEQLVERLELALEGSGMGIWDWDPRDNSVQFDRRWCEMLGLDHENVRMELSTWESRVHPDDLAGCFADIQAHMSGETDRYENVHRMQHADGHWVYILDRGRIAARDPETGAPSRFTGTHLDVTATERAKRVLEDQERILRELVQNVPAAVALLDTELRHLATSRRWPQALAAEDRERVQIRARWRELCARAVRGREVLIEEDPITDAQGEAQWWRWEIHPWRDAEGAIAGVLVSAADVTESVMRRAAEATESRLAALGSMAGGIAHEINTPLQILDLESTAILEELEEAEPSHDELGGSAECIAQTVNRLSGVVRAMRSLVRGSETDAPAPVIVAEVVTDLVALSEARLNAHEIDLRVAVEVPPDAAVVALPSDAGQILLNLLANATDAVRGTEAARVSIEVGRRGDDVCFAIRDNGPGSTLR